MNKKLMHLINNVLIKIASNIRVSLLAASKSLSVDLISSPTANRNGVSNVKYSVYVTGANVDRNILDTIKNAIGNPNEDPKIHISVSNISIIGDNYSDESYLGYQIDITVEIRYMSYMAELKNELSKTSKENKIITHLINVLSQNEIVESVVPAVCYNHEQMNIDIGCGLNKTDLLFNLYKYIDKEFDIETVKAACRNILGSAYVGLIETDILDYSVYLRNKLYGQLKYTLLVDWSKYDAHLSATDEHMADMSMSFQDLPYVSNSKISIASDTAELSIYTVSLGLSYDRPIDMAHNVLSDITNIVVNTFNVDVDKVKIVPIEIAVNTSRTICLYVNISIYK